MYQPVSLATPTGTVAAALASQARDHRLTVYAGAGISAAEPTNLPGAAKLAELVYNTVMSAIALDGVDRRDLVAVGDRVAAEPHGVQLLRSTILQVADLTGARYNYAHQALALLLCEGAVTVLETNYDDCIERAAYPERLPVVVTDADRLDVHVAALKGAWLRDSSQDDASDKHGARRSTNVC